MDLVTTEQHFGGQQRPVGRAQDQDVVRHGGSLPVTETEDGSGPWWPFIDGNIIAPNRLKQSRIAQAMGSQPAAMC
jgi:hypothetical protein